MVPGRGDPPLAAPRAGHVRPRPGRAGAVVRPPPPGPATTSRRTRSRALERFARLFGRTALAVEVFAVLEDLRVDAAALRLFAGLAPAYERVRHAALADRPELAVLPPRAAVAEALVRFSLGAGQVLAPAALRGPLSTVVAVARRLADPGATVESTAEAAIRVYAVLASLPNVGPIRTARPVAFDSLDADPALDPDDPRLVLATGELRLEGDEALDVRLVPVRYRDVPGPRYAGQAASGMPLQEAILRMTVDTGAVAGRRHRRVHRAVAAGRAGRGRRHRDRAAARAAPPRPRPRPGRPPRARARPPARTRPGRVRLPRMGPPRRPLPRRLVPGPAGQPEAGPVRPAAPARDQPARSPAARAGLPAGAGPSGRPDAGAAPAVRGRSRPGRLRRRDRRPAHRAAALAARLRGAAGGAAGRRGRAGDRPQLVHRRAAAAGPAPAGAGGADPRPAAGRGQPAGRGTGADR